MKLNLYLWKIVFHLILLLPMPLFNQTIFTNFNKIIVVSPNGGEKFHQSDRINIHWSSYNDETKKEVFIWDGIKKEFVKIADLTGNDFLWYVPKGISGDRFRIKVIEVVNNQEFCDFSNNFFEIKGKLDFNEQKAFLENSMPLESGSFDSQFKIIPNPGNETIKIISEKIIIKDATLTDVNGNSVSPKEIRINNSHSEIDIDISNLSVASYIIIIHDATGKTYIKNFIKN